MGLTIEAIAKEFNVSKPTWSTWELGTREPRLDVISAICVRLNCSANDLLGVSAPSSITVSGNGNAVAQGTGAYAVAGELPQCARCEHRKLAEKMRRMIAGK